ncbi:MAG: NAD(P)-binding domain-containing protein [Candidatus Marinimicrobia bacterium]|nr:NAD(P)-binding domain-containing protein [Candidatus Neomarinimicrobiota bacterium]MCF7827946.1 NAD(P)-binding domain-containing protein [Candidatus Neomarinimicrobiota bacterium]MCF7879299.1 NAD(P)-binding domain-containing protein [Candidatus Neomarinimicrobiota bacterium]
MAGYDATIDTVIIGGGQAGLAMSYLLTQQDREHLILEKQQRIGESWRNRWDSFTLVTPNWQLQLPGFPYQGDDPDGFLSRDEVVKYLEDYTASFNPPIRYGIEVKSVKRDVASEKYMIHTDDQAYEATNVVVAVGTHQFPNIPECRKKVPPEMNQLHSCDYKNPESLPKGGVLVVGSGQSGSQIAKELHENGRKVHLCVGSARRLPRQYRGRDCMWWADQLGIFDETMEQLDSPAERFAANPQVSGQNGGQDINLHQFARDGITLLGRLEDVNDGRIFLAKDLHQNLAAADKMAEQIRQGADTFVEKAGLDLPEEEVDEPKDGFEQEEIPELDLAENGINNILWATGFGWDYNWIHLPVFDEFDYPIQQQGVTEYPGLYFLGLHFLHTRKSGLFLGLGEDARYVADHLAER